jgi:hypothetical protein
MVKKVLTWGGIAFLLFFIAYRPDSAGDVFISIGNTFKDLAQGFFDTIGRMIA